MGERRFPTSSSPICRDCGKPVLGGRHADYFGSTESVGWLGATETDTERGRRFVLATDTTRPDPRLCADCQATRVRAQHAAAGRAAHV